MSDKKIIVVESDTNGAYESSVSIRVLDTECHKEFLDFAFKQMIYLLGYNGLADMFLSNDEFVKELYARGYEDQKMKKVIGSELGNIGPIRLLPNHRGSQRFAPGTKISNSDICSLIAGDIVLVQEIDPEKLEKLSPSSYVEYKNQKDKAEKAKKAKIKKNKLKADSKKKREIEKAKILLLKEGLLPSGTRDNY